MSSSAILGEIHTCENQILVTEQKVTRLQNKVELQEYAVRAFSTRENDLMAELSDKSQRTGSVVAYDPKAVVAVRFRKGMDADFSPNKVSIELKAKEINDGMRRELRNTTDLLNDAENELRRLKSRLGSLYSEYHAALAHEEAERQAAAAAAARA